MDPPDSMVSGSTAARKRVCIPYREAQKVRPYVAAVEAAGAEVFAVSVSEDPVLDGYDGLLLTGGTDVNPARYGASPDEHSDVPDDQRDDAEWRLLGHADESNLPILAICRGLQLLNVYRGGTLIQHLGSSRHDTNFVDRATVAHEVTIESGSRLFDVLGTERVPVNSRHHQAADRPGRGLVVSAWDSQDDSVIEGLEDPSNRFRLAVQWHPEDQAPGSALQRRLFEAFVRAL